MPLKDVKKCENVFVLKCTRKIVTQQIQAKFMRKLYIKNYLSRVRVRRLKFFENCPLVI